MFAFITTFIIICLVMWGFFKFMYPKPPAAFMPKEGDIITPRRCDFCGHPLAEYRGVLEYKSEDVLTGLHEDRQQEMTALKSNLQKLPEPMDSAESEAKMKDMSRVQKKAFKHGLIAQEKQRNNYQQTLKKHATWFFCNYEHQAQFHEQESRQHQ